MPTFEEQRKKLYQPVGKPAVNQPRPSGAPVSPDYSTTRQRYQPAAQGGMYRPGDMSSKSRAMRRHQVRQQDRQQQTGLERMRQEGQTGRVGMQQTGANQRVGMQQAGANQRQQAGFAHALQEQQNRFGQQNRMQQGRFDQQNLQQQNRFGQQNLQQQNRFGQQNSLDQNRLAQRNQEQQALFGQQSSMQQNRFGQQDKRDAFLAEQGRLQPNKVGTIRTYQNDLGGEQRYDSRTGEDYYPFSPIPFADRLNSGQ